MSPNYGSRLFGPTVCPSIEPVASFTNISRSLSFSMLFSRESVVAYDVNDRISDLKPLEVVSSFGRMPAGCTSLAAYWLASSEMTA